MNSAKDETRINFMMIVKKITASWILDFYKKMIMTEMGGEKVSQNYFHLTEFIKVMASWILEFYNKIRMTEMGREKVSPKLFESNRIQA